jgi:LysM repeat protein
MRFYGDMVDDGGGYGDVPQSVKKAATAPAKPPAPLKVEVERGDTLSSIAKENNTTVKAILAANPKFTEDPKYKGGNTIFAGTKVVIPPKVSKTPTPSAVTTPTPTPTPEPDKTTKLTPETKDETNIKVSETSSTTTKTDESSIVTQTDSVSSSSPSPTPITPADITTASVAAALPPPPPVKTASIDTVLFNDDDLPIEVMADLIFENIGGQELINISRNDIINGQKISYQPIKNISSIEQQYNSKNIIGIQSTSDKYFNNFSIKLENKVPKVGGGVGGSNVYIDPQTGNLVVEAVNLENDEQIEIEIAVNGTIYETEFGEITS